MAGMDHNVMGHALGHDSGRAGMGYAGHAGDASKHAIALVNVNLTGVQLIP
jgi:hypothetical protein